MGYKGLVQSLKKMLPPKIPYGELVGAPWPYTGQGEMVYEDPEPYLIEQAITAINDLLARAESAESRAEKAEQFFHDARKQEADRLMVYRTYQQNTLKVEELLHEINKELYRTEPDKDKLLVFCLRALEELTGTKFLKVREV